MSYSASMVIDTGGPEPTEVEYIQSFSSLLTSKEVEQLNGYCGVDIIPILNKWISDHSPSHYAMNTSQLVTVLQNIRNACERHPKATLRIE